MAISVKDAAGSTQTVQTLPPLGQNNKVNSLPVTLASNDDLLSAVALLSTQVTSNSMLTALNTVVTALQGTQATTVSVNGSTTSNTNPFPVLAPSGIVATASYTPTATAYSANDILSTAQTLSFTLANGQAVPTGSMIRILSAIVKINESALQVSEGAYQLQLYTATPPSAQADNAAWSLAGSDVGVYQGSINLGTPFDLGGALFVRSSEINMDIKLTGSGLFGQLQTLATFTPTAVARQVLLYGIIV